MKPLGEIKTAERFAARRTNFEFMKTKPTAGTGRPVREAVAVRAAIVAGLTAASFFVDVIRNSRSFRPTHT